MFTLRKSVERGLPRVPAPFPPVLFTYCMYQKEEVAEARDTNTEFTCQYESPDLSIFQNMALGAQHVTLAYNEASLLSQNMFCMMTMLQ